MTLPAGAYKTEEGWIVYGDEAYLPHEWELIPPFRLTKREREVVELLASGKASTIREAANHLGLALSTVRNLLYKARMRCGLRSTADLCSSVMRGEL